MLSKKRFILSERGATAIEYVLLACGVAMAIAAFVFLLGDRVLALFTDLAQAFSDV